MNECFLICKSMYILKVYSIHYTLRKSTNVEKTRFLHELKYKFRLYKSKCGIFNFRFRFVLLKFIFCSTKSMDSLTLKRHDSFQNLNNRKATHKFAPRPLIFKLKQKVLKFNDICVSWSSLKPDLETNFLNLEN